MHGDAAEPDLGELYASVRERVTSLVSQADEPALDTPVTACPGWSVRDVVAHLTAVAEDVVAGRLTRPPSPAETADQVARYKDSDLGEVLANWDAAAPGFESVVNEFRVWPAVVDVTSHEHDIRAALGCPGARDADAVWHAAQFLLDGLRPPVSLRVVVEDAEFRLGPERGSNLTLTTNRFEALRWRMGRRSREQLATLDWSADPAAVLDHLVVFGPASYAIVE
ncbi:MAG TPA: maleylpyruvate isomerase family mycothiol-dependent enzyme [Streptosporangiaceae bacterium]|nr:maleylpyruvate isomerase family mycothiol-dependent enzyme [Streptosporangiaceae bacterium]